MAKRVKMDKKAGTGGPVTTSGGKPLDHAKFKKLLDEADRQSKLASEYAGSAGKVIRDGIDAMSLNRKAVQMTRTLNRLDPAKRNEAVRCAVEYWEAAGFFDQMDAFSDTVDYLKDLLGRLEARIPNREKIEPDSALGAVLN